MILLWLSCLPGRGMAEDGASHQGGPAGIGTMISGVTIHVDGDGGRETQLEAFAQHLVDLDKGTELTADGLQQAIKSLKQSGLFREIDIPDPVLDKGGVSIHFNLKAYKRIKDVKVFKAFPLMEKRVKNAMRLYAGDPYKPLPLKEKEERVEELYRKAGYPNPDVTITAFEEEDGVVIHVRVDKGEYYRISDVEVLGNKAFSDFRLKLRTDTYKASLLLGDGNRFISEKLDQDIKDLIRLYRSKGYADVSIQAENDRDEFEKHDSIRFIIDEGPKYVFFFQGNDEFRDFTLKKEIDLIRRGNPGDTALKRGIRAIRDKYHKSGYKNVYVSMESKFLMRKGKKIRKVTFVVDEGERSIIEDLAFKGNRNLSDRELGKQVLTRSEGMFTSGGFDPRVLSEDIAAMKSMYRKKGFQDPEITPLFSWRRDKHKNRRSTLTFEINEGRRTLVGTIRLPGLGVMAEEEAKALLNMKEGGGFSQNLMDGDATTLSAAISEKGYPRVTVKPEVVFDDSMERVQVVFYVDQGPYIAMGDIVVLGNFLTKRKIIVEEMELLPGDPFSLSKFLESQRNIRNINALYGADFKEFGLVEKKDRVDLVVGVQEKKPYYFQAAAGYDTSRHAYINSKLGDRNLLGLNEEGWIAGELSEIGYRAETGLTEPRFLGTRISSTLNLFTETLEELNKDFGTQTHGMTLHFSRDFWTNVNTSLAFSYQYRDQYQLDADVVPADEVELYKGRRMVVTSPAISYDSTDSFIRPKKGVFTSLGLDISKALGDAPDEFLKYSFQANVYRSPLSFLTLAFRFRYGYIQPTGGTTLIPDDQLLFLGGTANVRGFDENMLRYDFSKDPVGGRERVMGSVEIRTDLPYNLELTTFFDTGRVGKTETDEGIGRFRSSVGAGIRYLTPIGPVGFLYGFKLNPETTESKGQLHFTIGYSF